MPWGFKRADGVPEGQEELIRQVAERRRLLDVSQRELAEQSGYYGRSMLAVLERTLHPDPPRVPRMTLRGMVSLRQWLERTDKQAAKVRKQYGLDGKAA